VKAVRAEPVEGSPLSGWLLVNLQNKINIAGGSPAASYFLLLRQNKVTKEKATPVYRRFAVPCVARLVRRLRNSHCVLRQSSPKSPDQPALLGGAQGKEKQKCKFKNSRSGYGAKSRA
jgi:hypothetical protein